MAKGKPGLRLDSPVWLALIRIYVGCVWLYLGWRDLGSNTFISRMANTLNVMIGRNPYDWYNTFAREVLLPNARLMGTLTAYGEMIVGVSLALGLLTNLGGVLGILFSLNLYFAAGWANVYTGQFALLLTFVQLVILFGGAGRTWGLDRLLARWLPRLTFVAAGPPKNS